MGFFIIIQKKEGVKPKKGKYFLKRTSPLNILSPEERVIKPPTPVPSVSPLWREGGAERAPRLSIASPRGPRNDEENAVTPTTASLARKSPGFLKEVSHFADPKMMLWEGTGSLAIAAGVYCWAGHPPQPLITETNLPLGTSLAWGVRG